MFWDLFQQVVGNLVGILGGSLGKIGGALGERFGKTLKIANSFWQIYKFQENLQFSLENRTIPSNFIGESLLFIKIH